MRRTTLMMLTVPLAIVAGGCADNEGENSSHARGSEGTAGEVTVQNAYLVPALLPGTCVIQYDAPAELSFTATNNAGEPDRLVGIESPAAGSVRIQADPDELVIAADGALAAGQPVEQPDRPGSEAPITVDVVELRDWVQPGRNLDMRFTFENAGTVQMAIPVDACPTQQTP
ncbi:copper chaperone PCu(A)C [Nocardia sputi]|uniref:copper chaperone PCu(A)C n=1 Tax=Nocardia sputi TaxID=2943705 RepID=UPI0020BEF72E|nr:copper chaperone PCu(A)C [Nocardia sputi]